jgi:hypothetical protein
MTPDIYGATIPPEQRGRAVSAAAAGAPAGIALFYLVGPLVEGHYGWRGALKSAGLVGIPWLMMWLKMDVDPPMVEVVGPGMLSGRDFVGKGGGNGQRRGESGGCVDSCIGWVLDEGRGRGDAASLRKPVPWRALCTTPSFVATAVCHAIYSGGS